MRSLSARSTSAASILCGLIVMGAVLSACSPPAEKPERPAVSGSDEVQPATDPTGPATAHGCEAGRAVSVLYIDQSQARLTRDGKTLSLTAAPSGSGARYVGEGVEWRTATRGDRETGVLTRLEAGGQPGPVLERCSRPAPAPVTPPPCVGGQLKLSLDGGDAGMGNRVNVLALTNTGPTACVTGGYPTVSVLDGKRAPLANVVAERGPDNYFNGGPAPKTLTLAAGAKAVFDLAWNVVPHEAEGETVCPTATTVRVSAPGDAAPLDLAQTFTPCGGRVRVSPLRPADASPN